MVSSGEFTGIRAGLEYAWQILMHCRVRPRRSMASYGEIYASLEIAW